MPRVAIFDTTLRDGDVGEVFIRADFGGTEVLGRAASTDLNIAAARSYLDAMNKAALLPSHMARGGAAAAIQGAR
ncbi:hypothetical protein [Candidatus Palauibacter sp.]|uniref:hypothetical protein n=1 Tax=Candidatus Palauibacter sp. TaxID=3101350 RepID=UPI003AF1F146